MVEIGFGGGCHWCTEAVFQSIKGVFNVEQGWIKSDGVNSEFSEGVRLCFDSNVISLKRLVEIHLQTHNATSNHSFRKKYRSAVYFFKKEQEKELNSILKDLQVHFKEKIITQILPFIGFKKNIEEQLNYYYTDANRPFCILYIEPKLDKIKKGFGENFKF